MRISDWSSDVCSSDLSTISPVDTLVGTTTLIIIVALSIWGSQRIKLFALLTGLLAGIVLTALLSGIEGLEQLSQTPVFGLPHLPTPAFHMDLGVLLAVAMLSLMTQLDTFGSAVLLPKMTDTDWPRADRPEK